MSTPTPADIDLAAQRIAPHIRHTPVLRTGAGAFGIAHDLTLKLELFQHSGSFKARGAFNRMLSQPVPAAGVIAASGGNHGAAVAYAARKLGHRAEIFVPTIASAAKLARLRQYEPTLTITGANYFAALAASEARQRETGALVVHAYDQFETLAGQGTLARELEAQAPDLDTLLVAVGGGGLIGGIAAWYRGRVRVVSVEPERAPSLHAALQAGKLVDVEIGGIAADALGATHVGALMFEIAREHIRDAVLVSDATIVQAQHALWREAQIAAEPGGATALAALLSGAYRPRDGERVGVLVCGGNVALETLA
jgi:threonine dehydratase